MSFPRYPKYKASGVEWLGEVPEHWEVCALNYRYEVALGKMLDEKRITGKHLAPYLRNTDVQWNHINVEDLPQMDFANGDLERYSLKRGDLLVCEGGEVGRAAIWDAPMAECYYQKALHRIRARDSNRDSARFLSSIFAAVASLRVFSESGGKSTIAHLPAETLRRYRFPFPPPIEQTTIADFLDRETAKIDELVAEQQRLMELLKGKRQAVISQAVTRGLNPHAPMKPSGIEWLGDAPAHWSRTRIKRIARSGNKTFVDGDWIEAPYITTEGVRLLQCGNVGTGVFEEQGFRYVSEETFGSFDCTEVEPNNVLICRLQSSRTILAGRACLAPQLGVKMITSVDNCILKPASDFDPRYIVYQLSTSAYLSFIEVVARGGTRDRISRSMLGEIQLLAPPVSEQGAIADFLEFETAKFDTLIAEAQRAIDLLQERRTTLISAAVTGQIDVRDSVASAPARRVSSASE